MWKKLLPLVAAVFFPLFAGAQEAKPVIRFSPFFTQGIGIEETRFIESLIQSYLSDVGEVIDFFNPMPPSSASEGGFFPASIAKAPDYVLSGSIYQERDNRIFTLEIHNTVTKETSRSTTTHKTASDLALKARSLVTNVFIAPASAAKGAVAETYNVVRENSESITENDVIGTWRGETGIEMIRLQQGGKGVAYFSSGAQMALSYAIENNVLKVRQNSPNIERYYYPLPYGVAKQLSAEAGPMRWELLLYSGGTHLRGMKIATEAKMEANAAVTLLPDATRDSLWVRSGR